jgi:hypothetical protein
LSVRPSCSYTFPLAVVDKSRVETFILCLFVQMYSGYSASVSAEPGHFPHITMSDKQHFQFSPEDDAIHTATMEKFHEIEKGKGVDEVDVVNVSKDAKAKVVADDILTIPDRSVSIEHVERLSIPPTPLTKKQKLKKHWKRFWFCYLVGGFVFLAIFLPLL